jgi:hypothetical protein
VGDFNEGGESLIGTKEGEDSIEWGESLIGTKETCSTVGVGKKDDEIIGDDNDGDIIWLGKMGKSDATKAEGGGLEGIAGFEGSSKSRSSDRFSPGSSGLSSSIGLINDNRSGT